MTTSLKLENSSFFTLANGLRVMLCHIDDIDTSYVSMSVKSGHFYDPGSCQGLSHLLEHVMFLGSRHLPKANSVNDLIESCGGSINAWTGTEYANYHFNCYSHSLKETLPAFADMLRLPLMDPDALDKEIQAIDAEFQFKRKDDLRRLYQIHKETCNPAHPFSKFSVGNAEIFKSVPLATLHSMLQQFHQQYYVASNMCLCIFSSLPKDEVKAIIGQSFSSMKAGSEAPSDWPELYQAEQLGVQINIVPLQAARRMIVTFAMPGLHHDYRTKSLNYISHLLGDEGEGSLLAFLKARNWVTNLIAGSGIEGEDFKDFNVNFQLTQLGLEHRAEILLALFSYIRLLYASLDDPWRYEEKAQLAALAYQYEDNPKLLNVVCDYSQYLFCYSFDEIPQLRSTIDCFDRECIENSLSYMVPGRMRIKTIAPEMDTDKVCAHYDAHYQMSTLPEEMLNALQSPPDIKNIFLPPPNPYLGEEYHLTLPEDGYDTPQQIFCSEGKRCWFAQDHQFHIPKGDIYISFDSAPFCESLTAMAAKRIWLAALNDHLQSKYYRAEIAGLHYRIYGHQAGFSLHTRGFTNQQTLLASQLLSAIHEFIPKPESFEQLKSRQIQNLQNSLLNKPTNRLFSRLSVLIQRNTQAPVNLLKAVQDCTYEQLLSYRTEAFKSYYLESFMHGNWSSEEAIHFGQHLDQSCPHANGAPLSRAVTQLPVGESRFHEVRCEHDDAAVVLYLQAPSTNLLDTAMCMILEQMLAAPFFNVLRTEKQLGYVVGTGYVPHNQHPGISFYIQSPSHGPKELLHEMTTFLFEQLQEIEFYRFYWSTIQQNLLKQLEERDLSMSMKSQRLWVSLGMNDLQFNRNTLLAECVSKLTFEDIQAYATKLANRELFGELVLFASGKFSPMETDPSTTLNDIAEFKRNTAYFTA
ncbi:peptidase M16 [Alteromonas pelagimontana]|uniref:Protease 3 n=1 Tax=Alteromonas pelagimontana TaxID=1858656 RepID=A0A6M4M9M3_9ALTE|nr:insulinase family protein [Alteromonas pelagimontana]QJR79861.1 peptidase M16 [Alteromonas pelagimontana]